MQQLIDRYKHWRFKNTFLLILSLVAFFFLADTPFVRNVIDGIGQLGYLGAFLVGIFFVSTFTVAPASVVLFYLAEEMPLLELTLIVTVGRVLGDYIIFRFLKDRVLEELKPIFMTLGGKRLSYLHATPYFGWLAPVFGSVIIATPIPDEAGIALLGVSRLKDWQFLTLIFLLNLVGTLLIILLAKAL